MALETPLPPSLAMFVATCEALDAPRGTVRLTAFLRLPEEIQEQVWREVTAPDATSLEEGGTA